MNHTLAAISSLDPARLNWENLLICEKMLEMKLEETRRVLKRLRGRMKH